MLGHEHVLRQDRIAPGALHARHEPGVLDRVVALGEERERLIDCFAGLVGDHDPHQRPVGVQASRRPRPLAAHLVAAIDLADVGGGVQHPGDLDVGIDAEDIPLSLIGKPSGHPVADVDEGHHPRGRAARLGDRGGDLEVLAKRHLIAAEAPGVHYLERPRRGQRVDVLLGNTPIGFGLVDVPLQNRPGLIDPGQQFPQGRNLCRGRRGGGHDALLSSGAPTPGRPRRRSRRTSPCRHRDDVALDEPVVHLVGSENRAARIAAAWASAGASSRSRIRVRWWSTVGSPPTGPRTAARPGRWPDATISRSPSYSTTIYPRPNAWRASPTAGGACRVGMSG